MVGKNSGNSLSLMLVVTSEKASGVFRISNAGRASKLSNFSK
jgi:hypothetical protein